MAFDAETDVVNRLLAAAPGSFIERLRAERPEQVKRTQTSYVAALHPREPRNFSHAERAALACRMARLRRADDLAAHYAGLIEEAGSDAHLGALADFSAAPPPGRWRAILEHVDRITLHPAEATAADIAALKAAGLDDRDIVTLSGLVAFVNYQILIVSGLKCLRDH